MRKIFKSTAVALGGMALVVAGQGVASAAQQSAESAPACVEAQEILMVTIAVQVTNNCDTTERVQVQYKSRLDPTCYELAPGETKRTYLPFNFSHFDGLVSC